MLRTTKNYTLTGEMFFDSQLKLRVKIYLVSEKGKRKSKYLLFNGTLKHFINMCEVEKKRKSIND